MSKTYEYFNNVSSEMDSCARNATLFKRSGDFKKSLEIWKQYPIPRHPYQLIAFGKIYILLDDVNTAKMNLLEALRIYSQNEKLIDDPLKSNCLSGIEHLGYCLRENVDRDIYLARICGVPDVKVDWEESEKRMLEAILLLKRENLWCDTFNEISKMI